MEIEQRGKASLVLSIREREKGEDSKKEMEKSRGNARECPERGVTGRRKRESG